MHGQSDITHDNTSHINPFNPDNGELVNLSTVIAAPPELAKDLLLANKVGEEAYETFKKEPREANVKSKQFHDKITQLKIFSDIQKSSKNSGTSKEVVLKADRRLFGQMIIIAESKELHTTDVLAHPLGPLPWALASGDKSLCKNNKAALARIGKKCVSS